MTFLTEDDVALLALAMLQDGPVDERTIERFVTWAKEARIENTLVDLALHGQLKVKWSDEDEDWTFASPTVEQRQRLRRATTALEHALDCELCSE